MTTLYTFTAPVFIKTLGGLKNTLLKAQAHLKETGGDESELLNDRLAPDMFPLVRQVQMATDNAKGATARLSGTENPKFEDTETTINELLERIDRVIAFIQSVPESAFQGAEERHIELPYFKDKYFLGFDYAREYALPNFFFHVVTAYAIIRKNGVTIGKADYINHATMHSL